MQSKIYRRRTVAARTQSLTLSIAALRAWKKGQREREKNVSGGAAKSKKKNKKATNPTEVCSVVECVCTEDDRQVVTLAGNL